MNCSIDVHCIAAVRAKMSAETRNDLLAVALTMTTTTRTVTIGMRMRRDDVGGAGGGGLRSTVTSCTHFFSELNIQQKEMGRRTSERPEIQ